MTEMVVTPWLSELSPLLFQWWQNGCHSLIQWTFTLSFQWRPKRMSLISVTFHPCVIIMTDLAIYVSKVSLIPLLNQRTFTHMIFENSNSHLINNCCIVLTYSSAFTFVVIMTYPNFGHYVDWLLYYLEPIPLFIQRIFIPFGYSIDLLCQYKTECSLLWLYWRHYWVPLMTSSGMANIENMFLIFIFNLFASCLNS